MFNFMALRNGGIRECFKNDSYAVSITQENVVERSDRSLNGIFTASLYCLA